MVFCNDVADSGPITGTVHNSDNNQEVGSKGERLGKTAFWNEKNQGEKKSDMKEWQTLRRAVKVVPVLSSGQVKQLQRFETMIVQRQQERGGQRQSARMRTKNRISLCTHHRQQQHHIDHPRPYQHGHHQHQLHCSAALNLVRTVQEAEVCILPSLPVLPSFPPMLPAYLSAYFHVQVLAKLHHPCIVGFDEAFIKSCSPVDRSVFSETFSAPAQGLSTGQQLSDSYELS